MCARRVPRGGCDVVSKRTDIGQFVLLMHTFMGAVQAKWCEIGQEGRCVIVRNRLRA
jgi:hypothetical protein